MKLKLNLLTLALIFSAALNAQHQKQLNSSLITTEAGFTKSAELSSQCLGLRKSSDITDYFMRTVTSGPVYHASANKLETIRKKEEKTRLKFSKLSREEAPTIENGAAVSPTLGTNFLGNEMFGGTPPDNSMAVSNGGIIVSADNATIEIYDGDAADPYLSTLTSHSDFFSFLNPSPTGSLYDPKVLYDSDADRFIYLILHGTSSAQSELLICFSQSNNPAQDGWWVYRIQGNQGHAGSWFDYPNIAVSNNEFYVTGNMFTDAGDFSGNVLFQIEKNACYQGGNINYQYWSNVVGQGNETAFTMVPLSWGQQGNYGPGVIFVANETSEPSDRIMVFDLTNDMSASDETINAYDANTSAFDVGGNAAQNGSNILLDIGDNRIQNGFYLNGNIHLVFTGDIGQGWNGIHYKRIDVTNMAVQSSTYGLQGTFDYCYPAVASSGSTPLDKSVTIGFLRSGQTIFPEFRAVNCDHDMQWSSSTEIKAGQDHVNILGGNPNRWGDYSGISRRNGANRTVWASGCYGQSGNHFGVNNGWNAWIAELTDGNAPASLNPSSDQSPLKVYPNPTVERFSIEFDMPERSAVSVELFDVQGKLVRTLLNDNMRSGMKILHFNRKALSSGTYNITVKLNNQTINHEELIVN